MIAVVTGFGVILAISASRSFAPASVCLASTTMTPVLPMMIVLLPPAPPRPAHTSGFSIFMVIGAGVCAARCCARPAGARRLGAIIPKQRILACVIRFVLSWEKLYYGTGVIKRESMREKKAEGIGSGADSPLPPGEGWVRAGIVNVIRSCPHPAAGL